MGIRNTKSSLRNAIIILNISADPISVNDDKFWSQFWLEDATSAALIIGSVSVQEVRMLRDGSPRNFATLTYKMIERLRLATGTLCNTSSQQNAVLNATRILTKLVPCAFEDELWRDFFIQNHLCDASGPRNEPQLIFPKKSARIDYRSYLPSGSRSSKAYNCSATETLLNSDEDVGVSTDLCENRYPGNLVNLSPLRGSSRADSLVEDGENLARSLIISICDLLFCPEFTVLPRSDSYLSTAIDAPPEDLKSLVTCDYIWEPGVGFESKINSTTQYDNIRSDLLRLLLACLSTTLYETPKDAIDKRNYWIEIFASSDNRHVLPIFASLLNSIFVYKPCKSIPFNYLLFQDTREELVELALQILIATLDYRSSKESSPCSLGDDDKNLFIVYMSRIHRKEDFDFIIDGFSRLLNSCFDQGSLMSPSKRINFNQELLVLFWRVCNLNKKFMSHLLKTGDVLNIVVPILYNLDQNFLDQTKSAQIHLGVFNLLMLSGERNFGVWLNKPCETNILFDSPTFSGSHADLTIVIFHRLILHGQNLNQLFDFLLTIIVNISPYLKALSMMASKCLMQLFEIFSSAYVVFTEPNYHHLVTFLLETMNNIIQYQYDGNANLVYVILTKKEAFSKLANLPTSHSGIQKVLRKLITKRDLIKSLEVANPSCKSNDTNPLSIVKPIHEIPAASSFSEMRATVSSNGANKLESSKKKVSLVKTPDIHRVTLPTHLYDSINGAPKFESAPESLEGGAITTDYQLNHQDNGDYCDKSHHGSKHTAPDDFELEEVMVKDQTQATSYDLSLETNLSLTGWKINPEWVKRWKQTLPLPTILRMISVLSPQLEPFNLYSDQVNELEAIKFIQDSTLVGLLPVPHSILIRKYRPNSETTLWFRTCTWGVIYVRSSIWCDTALRLLKVD